MLSPGTGQVSHALLTRPPLSYTDSIRKLPLHNFVRLACVRHAASVHPEPGSNSHVIVCFRVQNLAWLILNRSTVFKVFVLNVLIHGPKPRPFFKNFQGFTYCSVFKVLRCWLLRSLPGLSGNSDTLSYLRPFVNNFFYLFSTALSAGRKPFHQ